MKARKPPPSIPGYRITGRLGRGGMGTVWKARRADGTPVAVKVPEDPGETDGAGFRQLFRREALSMLNLDHPALVRGLDVGETADGRPFIVMEIVEGVNLWKKIAKEGPLPEALVVRIGMQAAAGLDHAHRLGVLHRDVKPDNLMLLPDGGVKLVDFGLVVPFDESEGMACYTPGFASPEALHREPLSPRSDLYSLGLTLAAAVTGKAPFQGETSAEIARQSLVKPLALPPKGGEPALSDGLRAVIERLARKNPAERYASAAELLLDLETVSEGGKPFGAFLGMRSVRMALRNRRRAILLAAGALVLAAAAILAIARSRSGAVTTIVVETPRIEVKGPDDAAKAAGAVLLYLDQHPLDFTAGRRLLDACEDRKPEPPWDEKLARARAALERRFEERAASILREKKRAAVEAVSAGDLDGAARVLSDWPDPFSNVPQVAEAAEFARSLKASALEEGDRLLADMIESKGRWSADPPGDAAPVEDLLFRIDSFLSRRGGIPEQKTRIESGRPFFSGLLGDVERRRAVNTGLDRLATLLAGAAGGTVPEGLRGDLESLARNALARTPAGDRVLDVLAREGRASSRLEHAVTGVRGRPWAGIRGRDLFVGIAKPDLDAASVFLPGVRALPGSPRPLPDDVVAAARDREGAAAFALLRGCPHLARAAGSPSGPVAQLMDEAGIAAPEAPGDLSATEAALAARLAMSARASGGPLPAPVPGADPLTVAWREFLSGSGAGPGARRPAAAPENPAKDRGMEEFIGDDLLGAWTSFEEAARIDPLDPEIAILRARIVWSLCAPLRTSAAALTAFSEARRAWDIDPDLPSAPGLMAEVAATMGGTESPWLEGRLDPAAAAAAFQSLRLGQTTAPAFSLAGEMLLQKGDARAAAELLARGASHHPKNPRILLSLARAQHREGAHSKARENLETVSRLLGSAMPGWAADLLRALSK